jgi:DNA-directed RNA polymerase subunit RPC12/RpoP
MNRFKDVAKSLKHRADSPIACPRCGSLDLSQLSGMDGWMVPSTYVCRKCGYAGRVVVEVDRDNLIHDKEGQGSSGEQ